MIKHIGLLLCFCVSMYVGAKVKVAFWINFLSMWGIEVSVYDFADFNETILGNESLILNNLKMFKDPKYDSIFKIDYNDTVREKFIKRFGNRFYDCENMQEANEIMKREEVDFFYSQKGGEPNEICSAVCKNIFHAVFNITPHGDAYASISSWLCKQYNALHVPVISLIIRLDDTKENLRQELGIPQNAVVFGRHGGITTFDIPFAVDAVREIAQQHTDWYFLFLNTNKFCDLKNIIFLPGTADLVYKTKL